jgi:hypothetical protein
MEVATDGTTKYDENYGEPQNANGTRIADCHCRRINFFTLFQQNNRVKNEPPRGARH